MIQPQLLHQLCEFGASQFGEKPAIVWKDTMLSFQQLHEQVQRLALGLESMIQAGDRVAVFLPKTPEAVVASFAVSAAGGVLVPINPVLKPPQVRHILQDSGAKVVISQQARIDGLLPLDGDMHTIAIASAQWQVLLEAKPRALANSVNEDSLAALLYTSGSTGLPKGVMLSHKNLVLGARSVAHYLGLSHTDRILAVLPFSFDYGLNQLLSSVLVGAQCVLLDYLLPNDIVKACTRYQITGLAGVPPLWVQLSQINWPAEAVEHLRYFTNSGGHLALPLLQQLQQQFHHAEPVLMYGLTEAFRSSYVPPDQLANKPDSMGIAIPHADLYVLNDDNQPCAVGEKGQLVHAGDLVAQGYWQQAEKTAERFGRLPAELDEAQPPAVWSGDYVYRDEDGYLYFSGRNDNQIKVSGYRISPEEIEQVLLQHEAIQQAAVFGVADDKNGQAIVAVVESSLDTFQEVDCIRHCRLHLAAYMQPSRVLIVPSLPVNANGKLNRPLIQEML